MESEIYTRSGKSDTHMVWKVGYTEGDIYTKWDTHTEWKVGYTQSEKWDTHTEWKVKYTHRVETHRVESDPGYTRKGTYTRWDIYMKWDTHTEWKLGYTHGVESRIHTRSRKWDTQME